MARILDFDSKYRKVIGLLIAIFIVFIIIALIVSSIKLINKDKGTIAVVTSEGDLVINYIDGNEISFFDNKEHTYNITITNNSKEKIYYSLYLQNSNVTKINVEVRDYEDHVIKELNNLTKNEKLINLNSINSLETLRFKIVFEPKEVVNFKSTLRVENESLSTNSFDDLILLNNDVVAPLTRVGNEIATMDEGLINTIDNKGTTHYFRGNAEDNYVKLGKLMFRIVRINGDGTVRLVLDNVLDKQYVYNSKLQTDLKENESLAVLNNSSLMNILLDWLNTNLKDYSSFITEGDFCTDTTFNYTLNNNNYSKTYERIYVDMAPDLYCNGELYTSKVGLLSIDEVVLAGAYKTTMNDKFYLYNKDISGNYLTTSTYSLNNSNTILIMNVMSNGSLGEGLPINTPAYIRPVINISTEAKVKGKGTKDNPYIIVS